jgi:hypothetical protein
MKQVILQNFDRTFAVNDVPDFVDGELQIFVFLSAYDEVKVSFNNGPVIGIFKHIALSPDRVFVYDVRERKCLGSLGPYELRDA